MSAHQHGIPHEALLLICDGAKAIVARNLGSADHIKLDVILSLQAPDNPQTSESGSDRPGRVMQSFSARRSAVEVTDSHELAKVTFLGEATQLFERIARENHGAALVVVAPPTALGVVRDKLARDMPERSAIQIDKDLTKHPVQGIARILSLAEHP